MTPAAPSSGPAGGVDAWLEVLARAIDASEAAADPSPPSPALPSADEAQVQAQAAFGEFLLSSMETLAQDLPCPLAAEYAVRATDAFDALLAEVFAPPAAGAQRAATLAETVVKANQCAQQALGELQAFVQSQVHRAGREARRGPDPCPQVVAPENGQGEGPLRLIRRAPQIEHLVLRGGGAKGIGYPAALQAMENDGLLDGLRHLHGSSVGALAATCLACGHSAEALATFSRNASPAELEREPPGFAQRYPGVRMGWAGLHHGGRALELMDEMTSRQVSTWLLARPEVLKDQALSGQEQQRLRQLSQPRFGPGVDRSSQMVTFGDLALLHRLDPARFKRLTLTGYERAGGKTHYFNAETTPDLPLAVAARISMSIPGYFRSVETRLVDGRMRTFIDGAVGDALPVPDPPAGASETDRADWQARTALLTFDEGGGAAAAQHGIQESWTTRLRRRLDPTQANAATRAKVHQAGPNAFVVGHGDLATLDLHADPARRARARLDATARMMQQVSARREQAYLVEYPSPRDCLQHLSRAEREALARAPEPVGHSRAAALQRELQQLARGSLRSAPGNP